MEKHYCESDSKVYLVIVNNWTTSWLHIMPVEKYSHSVQQCAIEWLDTPIGTMPLSWYPSRLDTWFYQASTDAVYHPRTLFHYGCRADQCKLFSQNTGGFACLDNLSYPLTDATLYYDNTILYSSNLQSLLYYI